MKHVHLFILDAQRKRLSCALWNQKTKTYDDSSCPTRDIKIEVRIANRGGRCVIEVTYGGITGLESFYVSDIMPKTPGEKHETGLFFCAGTPGRWDSLSISADEYNALCDKIRELKLQCCELDTDYDGNCPRHPAK